MKFMYLEFTNITDRDTFNIHKLANENLSLVYNIGKFLYQWEGTEEEIIELEKSLKEDHESVISFWML